MWLPAALLAFWLSVLPHLLAVLGSAPGIEPDAAAASGGGSLAAPADSTADQIVAVLHLRREDLPHAIRGEIYPVARIVGGRYEDALVTGPNPLTGEPSLPAADPTGALDSAREFTVYDRGAAIGSFAVTDVGPAVYSCRGVMVGFGRLEIPQRYVRFGRFDPRVHSLAVSGQGVRYEYTLNYYLALGRRVPQAGFRADSTADRSATSRLRAAVWTAGIEALSEYGEGPWLPGARWEDPRWSLEEEFQVFDLDRDGRLEGVGVMEAIVTDDGAPVDGGLGPSQYVATAIVWTSDPGEGRPEPLLVLRHAREVRHWNFGYHLAEVMDLDGDGVAEPFYQVEAWEYYGFQIYALRDRRLHEVFSGAAYGC
ncbi:MAG: hypothetical protein ACREK7_11405 [Gemmatimonadota bacterium]